MKLLCFIFLLLVLCGTVVGLTREYYFVNITKNWTEAQKYCRQKHRDLATITTEEESKEMIAQRSVFDINAWIGLNRKVLNQNIWQWSGGEQVSFLKWATDQPDNFKDSENCVSLSDKGWNDIGCFKLFPFYCYRNWTLVSEKKTWLGALEYCRNTYIGLVSLDTTAQLLHAESEIARNKTVSLWTGLRFLEGQWLWISGEPLDNSISLPSCPAPGYQCRAYNFSTKTWEKQNCNEKLNFICY